MLLHFVAQCDFNGISTENFNDCHLILDGDNSTYKVLEGGEGVSIISHTLEIDPNCVETNEARKNQCVSSLSFSRSRVSHEGLFTPAIYYAITIAVIITVKFKNGLSSILAIAIPIHPIEKIAIVTLVVKAIM